MNCKLLIIMINYSCNNKFLKPQQGWYPCVKASVFRGLSFLIPFNFKIKLTQRKKK